MPTSSPLLFLLRHGRAERSSPQGDDARGLTEDGREDALAVARFLAGLACPPRAVLSSPARRCSETAGIVAGCLPSRPDVSVRRELGLDAPLSQALALAREAGAGAVLVGHQPDLVGLAAALLDPRPVGFDLVTAGLAGLAPRNGSWRLALVLRPEEARSMASPA